MVTDGIVDLLPKLLADLDVLGSEPTSDTILFEITVQSRSELSVLARVTDEARVKLRFHGPPAYYVSEGRGRDVFRSQGRP